MTPRLKQPMSTACGRWCTLVRSAFCSGWAMPCQPGCWGIRPGADPLPWQGGLHLLLLTLLVSPLAKRWRQGQLIAAPPLGLWCAAWASLHFMVWLGLDLQFDWGLIGGELVKRSYIVVGMVALLLLLALGITSIPAPVAAQNGAGMAEAAQLDLRGGSAGAGTLLVVGQERVAGAAHLSGAGLRPAVAPPGKSCCAPAQAPAAGEGRRNSRQSP